MSAISTWSATAADNSAASPDGFPEGMAPSAVNNSARETMAAVRSYYESSEWRAWGHTITYAASTQFTTAAGDGDTTAIYHVGRRVHANGSTTGDVYGTISSSSHSGSTTVTVVWDSGALQNEALTVEVGFAVNQRSIGSGSGDGFASGTRAPFYQPSAPVGWTIYTTGLTNTNMLVVGTGGTTGGSTSSTNYAPGAFTPTGTNAVENGHTHMFTTGGSDNNTGIYSYGASLGPFTNHTHSGSTEIGTNHNHDWTSTLTYSPTPHTPYYATMIIAEKD